MSAKAKYEIIEIDSVEVTVDVSLLIKSEDLFFNATKVLNAFKQTKPQHLEDDSEPTLKRASAKVDDWLKQKQTIEYIKALITFNCDKTKDDLIHSRRGRYGGTYIHHSLLFHYAEWLKPGFSLYINEYLKGKLTDKAFYHMFGGGPQLKNVYVIQCEGATKIGISGNPQRRFNQIESASGRTIINKFLSKPLMNAYQFEQRIISHFKEDRLIGEWVTTQFDEVVRYASSIISNEADLLNRIILGMSAKKFKAQQNVLSVRDGLTAAQLKEFTRLQTTNAGLIDIGMDYDERKGHLKRLHEDEMKLLEGRE